MSWGVEYTYKTKIIYKKAKYLQTNAVTPSDMLACYVHSLVIAKIKTKALSVNEKMLLLRLLYSLFQTSSNMACMSASHLGLAEDADDEGGDEEDGGGDHGSVGSQGAGQ